MRPLCLRSSAALGAAFAFALATGACGAKAPQGPKADAAIITHGEKVDLEAHLAKGKYTVVDFYATWCPPCRVVGPALERLAAAEPARLALRKVDVVDWTMPVVEQYGIESLPHLMLYDPEGRRVADGDAVFKSLLDIFGETAKEVGEAGIRVGAIDAPGEAKTSVPGVL
ncbi:MAG TPA: thioredoxin family protein [Dongiaceae bacterium]|nr:thioredoxin family protein [Dongiaceae bacterium]